MDRMDHLIKVKLNNEINQFDEKDVIVVVLDSVYRHEYECRAAYKSRNRRCCIESKLEPMGSHPVKSKSRSGKKQLFN